MVRYALDDLDELLGFVAAEANHSTDKKLRKELDALYARLRREMPLTLMSMGLYHEPQGVFLPSIIY